jgi:amino acid adenylation domain-containing protein
MRHHIVEAIRGHARNSPTKCALADTRVSIDYATLDRFSTRFALRLRDELGCEPGDRVAMLASRRAILVAAILGAFKAGCVHVPLDPRMPAGRLEYILADVAPALVIADEELRDTIAAHPAVGAAKILLASDLDRLLAELRAELLAELRAELLAEEAASSEAHPSAAPPAPPAPPAPLALPLPALQLDDPAYCIYTSGSTGRPKGVLIDHRSIADFFDGTQEVYDVTADSVCASFSPLHFDVYLMDMLFPLAQGARLHVYDDVVAPDLLFETIRGNGLTHFSAWGMMLGLIAQAADFDTAPLPQLRTILTGTDVPDIKTVQRWLRKNPGGGGGGVRVINAYGPTEATCAATAHVIREIEPDRKQLYPIGKPLKHVRAFLVGDGGERITAATPEVPGELLIGGTQVMKGYWNLAGETAARLTEIDGVRCYRTGDVCTYLADGSLFYIGRKDNEVNIGGYRVHLNEVQRVINSVPHVYASEIVTLDTRYGEKILAAAILLDKGKGRPLQVDRQQRHIELVKRRLAEELPGYMVPRYVTVLDEFPQLSSGKADRKKLLSILEDRMNRQPLEVMAP